MDTQLVFNTAYVYSTVILVIDKHGQSTTVVCTFFRTCQNQVKVGITVRNETFHTVQAPAAVGFIVCSFQHHTLKVGTCIRFSQVH